MVVERTSGSKDVIPAVSIVIPAKAGPHTGHSQELGIHNQEQRIHKFFNPRLYL